MTLWSIELFGGLRAVGNDRTINRFSTRKNAALLAYLAYHLGPCHSRELLAEMLWPEQEPASARRALRVALTSLRHQLEGPPLPPGSVLIGDRSTIGLNPEVVEVDVREFQRALRQSAGVPDSLRQREVLNRAVELYTGPLLPGFYEEWVFAEQERLREDYLRALSALCELCRKAGDPERALRYARRAAQVEPLREECHLAVMQLLRELGRSAEAVQQYRALEGRLREELGIAPSERCRRSFRELDAASAGSVYPHPAAGEAVPQPAVPVLRAARTPPPAEKSGSGLKLLLALDAAAPTREGRKEWAALIKARGGWIADEPNTPWIAAFDRVADALEAACAVFPVNARTEEAVFRAASLHAGSVELHGRRIAGEAPELALRLLAAANPGQLLASEVVRNLAQSEGCSDRFFDLGRYRLGATGLPHRLYSVTVGTASPSPPPLPRAEPCRDGNTPAPLTRFFGREKEISQLLRLFSGPEDGAALQPPPEAPPGTRLVTLLGPGGSGKTRLALEVARRLQNSGWGSAWFVNLADLRDGEAVPQALLHALRQVRLPEMHPLEQVAAALGAARSLLVFDNAEHLVENVAEVVQVLLERVPSLTCLVTSTRPLGLTGEREMSLSPLPLPTGEGTAALEELVQCPSLQLLLDRGQLLLPDFQLTRANAPALVALCRRLEGLPLALELAAARLAVRTPDQILGELSRRLDLSPRRHRDRPARHSTLRTALEWSYRLLSPELQRLFCFLSVFRGSWTLEAAATVYGTGNAPELSAATGVEGVTGASPASSAASAGEDTLLEQLESLRECSLVSVELREPELRFRMLETLREFAWDQLAPDARRELQDRHARHFLRFAEERLAGLRTPGEPAALGQLQADLENLRAAADWAKVSGDPRLCGALALMIGRLLQRLGLYPEAIARVEAGLSAVRGAGARELEADLLREWAGLSLDQSDPEAACAMATQALALYRDLRNRNGEAYALNLLGLAARRSGCFDAARGLLQEALTVFEAGGATVGAAMVLNNLGATEDEDPQGDKDRAREYLESALAAFRSCGDLRGTAEAALNLGALKQVTGNPQEARPCYEEALRLFRDLRDVIGVARALCNLGEVALALGMPEDAVPQLLAARELFRRAGSPLVGYVDRLTDGLPTALPDVVTAIPDELIELTEWATR